MLKLAWLKVCTPEKQTEIAIINFFEIYYDYLYIWYYTTVNYWWWIIM